MNQLVINIAYIADNQSTVTELVDKLKHTNVHFNLIDAQDFVAGEDFQKHLLVEGASCLLMVSDNFLKSSACLKNGLSYLQALIKNEQVIPIIIDGVAIDAEGGRKVIPTEFEKVSNVIKYMNFWQEKYLDLRKLKRSIPEEAEAKFVEKLKIVRSISSEVGEYLRNLRDTNYYTKEAFEANNFEAFFLNFGDEAAYLNFVAANTGQTEVKRAPQVEERVELAEESKPDFLPLEQLIEEKEKLEQLEIENSVDKVTEEEDSATLTPPIVEKMFSAEPEIEKVNANEVDIDTLIETDPEWTSANEIDTPSYTDEAESVEDGALTDTELLALELAGKLPPSITSEPEIEGYFVDEEEEDDEEMISLEDLMGTDFFEESKGTKSDEAAPPVEIASLTGGTIKEAAGAVPPSMDLFSEQEESEEVVVAEASPIEVEAPKGIEQAADAINEMAIEGHLGVTEEALEEGEEMELEGYFVEEGEEGEELEEELNELDVLETANTLVQSGKIEDGVTFLKETLIEAPEFVSVRYQYAAFLAKYQNNFREASDQLAILLEQEPNNLSAKFFLGELAEVERDYLTAKGYYEKVYEENADFPNVAYKLGTLLVGHLREDPEQAARYFEQAYAQNGDNINALYQLGLLQAEELGEEENAIDSLETVLKKAPEHPFANYDLAIIYHNEGQRDKALRYYVKAATVNPELKTLVNDQAFAIAREKLEDTVQERGMESNNTLETASIDAGTLDADYPVEESMEEAEQLHVITTPQNIATVDDTDAFEFPFATDNDSPLEEESVEETVVDKIIPQKESTKIALITGATSGIGKATATKLAEAGYQLILTGRRFSRLFQMKDQFEKQYNAKVRLLPFDIKDADAVQSALAELEADWQSIDILINNAGLARGEAAFHEGELEHWDSMIDTNVKGLLYVTREIAPYMVKRKKGQIINVCSLAGKEVYPNNAVYCATKHAVDALTKAMRIDLHPYNIRVSQVSPGYVEDTEFSMVKHEQATPNPLDFTPINAQDVAEVIYFMTTQPAHVNLQEVTMTGTQQATANIIAKN